MGTGRPSALPRCRSSFKLSNGCCSVCSSLGPGGSNQSAGLLRLVHQVSLPTPAFDGPKNLDPGGLLLAEGGATGFQCGGHVSVGTAPRELSIWLGGTIF